MEEAGFLLQQEKYQRRHATTASQLQKTLAGLKMALERDPGLTNNVVRKIEHLISRLEQTSKRQGEQREGEGRNSCKGTGAQVYGHQTWHVLWVSDISSSFRPHALAVQGLIQK
jgi:hypothetical protein